jgi:hypothetical protein
VDRRPLNLLWLLIGMTIAISYWAQAHAATQTIAYEGVATTSGQTYLKLPPGTPVSLSANNVSVKGIINIAGKQVTMPASARLAANAGQYAVSALRSVNPLILGAGLLAYLALEQLEVFDGVIGQVTSSGPSGAYYTCGWSTQFAGGTLQDACEYWDNNGGCADDCWGWQLQADNKVLAYNTAHPSELQHEAYGQAVSCPDGTGWDGTRYPGACTAVTTSFTPATESQYADLADHDLLPAAAQELATDPAISPLGLPIDQPSLQTDPFAIPVGAPYQKPDGSWVQPMARITPQPDGKSAAIDLYDQPVIGPTTDADGYAVPVPNSQPTDTPEDPCTANPDTIGCKDLGDLDDPGITKQSYNFDLSPEPSPWSASCPADRVLSFGFGSGTLSYSTACSAMDMIRPLVLGLAWLVAGYILIGGVRSDG